MKKDHCIFIYIAFLCFSCSQSYEYAEVDDNRLKVFPSEDLHYIERGKDIIDDADARIIAKLFNNQEGSGKMKTRASICQDSQIDIICEKGLGRPLLYIVNYDSGGFIVVSASKKTSPVLACAKEGCFNLEDADGGAKMFMEAYKAEVKKALNDNTLKSCIHARYQ